VKARSHGSGRNSYRVGNLLDRHIFQKPQEHYRAVFWGKLLNRVVQQIGGIDGFVLWWDL
jgi:hypothetical protein